jgi:S1-C subfamily serine protease
MRSNLALSREGLDTGLVADASAISLVAEAEPHLYDPIVKVFATIVQQDFYSPWRTQNAMDCSGSAFVIDGALLGLDGPRLMTNAHVVSGASFIQVRRFGSAEKFVARTVAISNEMDLAVLEVVTDGFFAKVLFFSFASG